MAEQIKKVIEKEVTYNQLKEGKVTILETDANTSVVLRDLYIKGDSIFGDQDIYIDGDILLETVEMNEHKAMNKIIPASSKLEIDSTDLGVNGTQGEFVYTKDGSNFYSAKITTGDKKITEELINFSTGLNYGTSNQDRYYYVKDKNTLVHFREDGNSITYIAVYKNGNNNAVYARSNHYHGAAFDGKRYIYRAEHYNLYRVDTWADNPTYNNFSSLPYNCYYSYPKAGFIQGKEKSYVVVDHGSANDYISVTRVDDSSGTTFTRGHRSTYNLSLGHYENVSGFEMSDGRLCLYQKGNYPWSYNNTNSTRYSIVNTAGNVETRGNFSFSGTFGTVFGGYSIYNGKVIFKAYANRGSDSSRVSFYVTTFDEKNMQIDISNATEITVNANYTSGNRGVWAFDPYLSGYDVDTDEKMKIRGVGIEIK